MRTEIVVISAVVFSASAGLTAVVRRPRALPRSSRCAKRAQLAHGADSARRWACHRPDFSRCVDRPGVGFGLLAVPVFAALSGGGLAVAAIGFADDRKPIRARTRLIVHFAAALWAIIWLGGLPPLQLGPFDLSFGWLGYPLGVLLIVWSLNLFNFMDGIDGIAASEAVFIALAAVVLMLMSGVGGRKRRGTGCRSGCRMSRAFSCGTGHPPGSSWATSVAATSATSSQCWPSWVRNPRRCPLHMGHTDWRFRCRRDRDADPPCAERRVRC